MKTSKKVQSLLKNKSGIKLDLGCGGNKQPGFVGIDMRKLPGVDIVHDLEKTPFPLPDECCLQILASHILEHISPKRFIPLMNELWRIMKVGGQLLISSPYGVSPGFQQDPTHINIMNESTWLYYTPISPFDSNRILYNIYKPKPWRIERNNWNQNGNMEVILEKIKDKKEYKGK